MSTSPDSPSATSSSTPARQWAVSMTKTWTEEVQTEWRLTGDTEANAQARESAPDVQWVHESGYCIRFTEVNETTIDVTYDRWSQCENEDHAQNLFVVWAQAVSRWSQRVTSSTLIESG
ncbi:hypothetical protein PI124_g22430 [Phytophthora idaei]|nr:hypothetical protein PI124_g22430 [Phytophthora idaei]